MFILDWLLHQIQTNMFSSGAVVATICGAVLYSLKQIPYFIKRMLIYFLSIEITVRNNTDVFDDICVWIEKQGLLADTRRLQLYDYYASGYSGNVGNITFSTGVHWFWYKRRPVLFYKELANRTTGMFKAPEDITMYFLFRRNPNIVDEFVASVLTKSRTQLSIQTYVTEWKTIAHRNYRDINSVILPENTKKLVLDDIKHFYGNKQWYLDRGILYKRGYLFVGPPGTGKTSFVLAIASLYKKSIYSINLKTLTDSTILNAFIDIPLGSIILLEDIDAVTNNVLKRDVNSVNDTSAPSVSLSTILNVLDGVYSKEDTIIIMTSNYHHKLDDALLRKGRVDMVVEFQHFDMNSATKLFDVIIPNCDNKIKTEFINSFNYPIACSVFQEEVIQLSQSIS